MIDISCNAITISAWYSNPQSTIAVNTPDQVGGNYAIPLSVAPMTNVFGQGYNNTVACAVTYELIYATGASIPSPVSNNFDFRSDGNLWLNYNNPGTYSLKMKTTYDTVIYTSG